LHLGVIISGATTFLSSFFAGPPVSFYLAQCAIFFEPSFILADPVSGIYNPAPRQ
jgi:hypothetical protein